MEFKVICNLCKQIVSEGYIEHLKKFHKPIELFTLMPDLEWETKHYSKIVEEVVKK